MSNGNWILHNLITKKDTFVVDTVSVGRNSNANIVCYSDKVSRKHAIFVLKSADLYVQDCNSANGTYVNHQLIPPMTLHQLNNDDEVGIGFHSESDVNERNRYIFLIKNMSCASTNTSIEQGNNQNKIVTPELHPNPIFNQEIEIKKEPSDLDNQNCTTKEGKGYTQNSIIVIDDDDDNYDFPCSEISNIEATNIKSEDSVFDHIKKELEEFDKDDCTEFNNQVIDIEDDLTTEGLLGLLDDHKNINLNSTDNLLDVEKINSTNKISTEKCNELRLTNNKDKSQSESNQDNVKFTNDKIEDQILYKNKSLKSRENRFVKPPIISPHTMTLKRKILKDTDFKTKKKCVRDNDSTPNKNDCKSEAVNKEISKQRKDKLHAIALKEKKEANSRTSNKNAAMKVKISNTRGLYLTKPIETKTSASFKKSNAVSKCSLNNSITNSNKNESIKFSKNVEILEFPLENNKDKYATNSFPKRDYLTDFNISNNMVQHESQEIRDIISNILAWNTNWFKEKDNNVGLPPVIVEPLKKVAKCFSNYSEYYSIVKPHLLVNIWYFLCKEWDSRLANSRSKQFTSKIMKYNASDRFIHMDCVCYITKEENDKHLHLKNEDIVFVSLRFKRDNLNCKACFLANVYNVTKSICNSKQLSDRKSTSSTCDVFAQINFKLSIKFVPNILLSSGDIEIIILSSLVSTWRIIASVISLKNSPLCNYILKPSINSYNNFITGSSVYANMLLNKSQLLAVSEATNLCKRSSPGIYLIQGPPGTGKSTVIVHIIKNIFLTLTDELKDFCILLTASSNAAIDELLKKLINYKYSEDELNRKKLKIVRIGPEAMIHHTVHRYSLRELSKQNVYTNFEKSLSEKDRAHIKSLENSLTKCRENTIIEQEISQNMLKYHSERDKIYKNCIGRTITTKIQVTEESLLKGANIICTTLSSCLSSQILNIIEKHKKQIHCCIVDEATQSTEQETLIPLKLGVTKLILVGDPKQLSAMTFSKEAKCFGFGNSLFTRIADNFKKNRSSPIRFLDTQYRMHPEIAKYPSETYYDGKLKNHTTITKNNSNRIPSLVPYFVFQLNCWSNSEEYQNTTEINCVTQLIKAIYFISNVKVTIGIITPYNRQKLGIKESLIKENFKFNSTLSVNTVDSFQGQEKDIIILSCVRRSTNNFLEDEQRLNVALTRAKYALYIIGTINLFETCDTLKKVREDAKNRKVLITLPGDLNHKDFVNIIKQT